MNAENFNQGDERGPASARQEALLKEVEIRIEDAEEHKLGGYQEIADKLEQGSLTHDELDAVEQELEAVESRGEKLDDGSDDAPEERE